MKLLLGPLTPYRHVDPHPHPQVDRRATWEDQVRYVREALARGAPTDTTLQRERIALQPFHPYVAPTESTGVPHPPTGMVLSEFDHLRAQLRAKATAAGITVVERSPAALTESVTKTTSCDPNPENDLNGARNLLRSTP